MTNMNLSVRKIFYSRNGKSYFSKLITRSLWQIENKKAPQMKVGQISYWLKPKTSFLEHFVGRPEHRQFFQQFLQQILLERALLGEIYLHVFLNMPNQSKPA